jgi:hypothetical protein
MAIKNRPPASEITTRTGMPSQREENSSRRVRAGRDEVVSYEEKRRQLVGTRLGQILGLNEASSSQEE